MSPRPSFFMQRNPLLLTFAAISLTLVSGFTTLVKANDIELKIGIVQRFGDAEKDQLSISGASGDILTFRFLDGNNTNFNKSSLPSNFILILLKDILKISVL